MPDSSVSLMTFNFHGDELTIIFVDGEYWVVLARLCERFNVKVYDQGVKLKNAAWARTRIIRVPDGRGVEQETLCIHIRSVHGWLFTLNAKKISEALREKLARYQKECADALADRFLGQRVTALPPPEPRKGLLEQTVADAVGPLRAELDVHRKRIAVLEAKPMRQIRLLSLGTAGGPTEEELRALAIRLAGDPQRTFTSREHLATLLRVPLSLGRVIIAELLSTGELVKENGRIIARRCAVTTTAHDAPPRDGGLFGEKQRGQA